MNHVLAAEDWDEAERLAGPAAAQAINRDRFATVGRWLDTIEEETYTALRNLVQGTIRCKPPVIICTLDRLGL